MVSRIARALLLLSLLAGCDAAVENKAPVYPTVSGSFDLNWTPTVTGVQSVEFRVDGAKIGQDNDGTDGFAVEFDSTKLPNGLHTVGIIARGSGPLVLAEVDQSIVVQN